MNQGDVFSGSWMRCSILWTHWSIELASMRPGYRGIFLYYDQYKIYFSTPLYRGGSLTSYCGGGLAFVVLG